MAVPQSVHIPQTPRFRTDDATMCHDYIRDNTKTHNFALLRSSSLRGFAHSDCSVGRLTINWCGLETTEGFSIQKTCAAPYYSFQFVLGGTCQLDGRDGSTVVGPGEVFILDPEDRQREFWFNDCEQFIIRVDREIVERQLSEELARTLGSHLLFDMVMRDPGIVRWIYQVANSSWVGGQSAALIKGGRVSRSLERTLISMFLAGFRHTESESLERGTQPAAPYYVKRAETYIREQIGEVITIDDIAEKAGVSTRSLFYGFKRWRNTTPMAYIRDLRLEMARKELKKARSCGGTVSDAAINSGFTNFSQFSKLYKARFGEAPSVTLRSDS
jgi:AraC-like DNA-binding protein